MNSLLVVALGGAIGSLLRHAAGLAAVRLAPGAETAGTLFVNVVGSGLLGLLMGWLLAQEGPRPLLFLFLATGVCGGFTTFSTFSREAVHMFMTGSVTNGLMYIALSVAGSLGGFFVGLMIMRRIMA
jgi:fluoride exporter